MLAKMLLLFFVFSFLFRTDLSFDQDLGRHIKLGEIITKTHQVPQTNLFSYTNADFPFINTHWLFEVLMYGLNQAVGTYTILILKILIFLLSVGLIIKVIPKQNQVLLLPVGFIFLHVLRERLELRPEIFSFLFTASTYYILEKFLTSKQMSHDPRTFVSNIRLVFLLPFIQLLWINTHIYFFVGLILQVIFLIHATYQHLRLHLPGVKLKLLGGIFALSVVVSLLNPNGLTGLLFPLNVTKNYGYTIVENQTMFLLESIQFKDPNFLFVKLSAGIILLSLLIAFLRKGFELKNILLSLSGLALTLLNVRSFPYLVFLSLPAVLSNFSLGVLSKPPPRWVKILSLFFGLLLILESFFYLNGDYYKYTESQHQVGLSFRESGKKALDFALAHDLPDPIYNNFDIGSYIIYRGFPKYHVFVDGRPEAYPKEFFLNTYIPTQYDYSKFKALEKQYNFKTIIFSHTDQTPWGANFLKEIIKDKNWSLVYIDNFMVVLIKSEKLEKLKINRVDLATLTPDNYSFKNHVSYLRMGILLFNLSYKSGLQFIQKSYQVFPNSPLTNAILANLTGQSQFLEKSQSKIFW